MSEVPVQLIVAAFQDQSAAKEVLQDLKRASKEGLIRIENAAVLSKTDKGKLRIKETHDMGGGKGAVLVGVGGAAVGLIAGAALAAPVAVGALVGGLAAKLRDSGFSNRRLEALGANLAPGSSAIVAVVEHTWVAQVEEALAEQAMDVMVADIGADIAGQLETGHEVAYSVIAGPEGVLAGRLAEGESDVAGGVLAVDDGGLYGSRFVATDKGFVIEELVANDEGVFDGLVVGQVADEEEPE
jgi:uncharacterized membrane protein